MRPSGRYTLLILRTVELRAGRFQCGTLARLHSLPLAVELVRRGAAEPNDSATAVDLELALRLRAACGE